MNTKHDHERGPHGHPHEAEHDDCRGHENLREHGAHKPAPESDAR